MMYNPKNVTLKFNGVEIEGFSPDKPVTFSSHTPEWTEEEIEELRDVLRDLLEEEIMEEAKVS